VHLLSGHFLISQSCLRPIPLRSLANRPAPPADSAMQALGRRFEYHTFAFAGHGFLRQQEGQGGANLTATQWAWPLTIAFFRSTLGR
jgi:dienelactone hydrolase